MNELFDAIAGSETGAIIATTLMVPENVNDTSTPKKAKFFANKTVNFFNQHQTDIYKSLSISKVT